jgi:hypothetical protein
MSNQFKFGSIRHKTQAVRTIGYSGPPVKVGVSSVHVSCDCGHTWTAREGSGLNHVLGGVIVSCPACTASDHFPGRAFGL